MKLILHTCNLKLLHSQAKHILFSDNKPLGTANNIKIKLILYIYTYSVPL